MEKRPSIEFLKSVLGEEGQRAFERADKRTGGIGTVLGPRTILSWLTTAVRSDFEGEIPGLPNSYISLQKKEETFTGALTIGEHVYEFADADVLHVAASVAVALGLDGLEIPEHLKSTDISQLGKSIDMLVKARTIAKAITELYRSSPEGKALLGKVEKPGSAAEPHEPGEPQAPVPPTATSPATNKTTKSPMNKELVIKKEQSEHSCSECGLRQFKNDKFVGCMCFKVLAKSVTTKQNGDNYVLSFPRSSWDDESLQAILKAFTE